MAGKSAIEWTGHSWNPIAGCSVVSPGCTNCYAMRVAARLEAMGQALYAGLTRPSKAGPVWTGEVRLAGEAVLQAPLRRAKPTTWFVNSMSDLFHEAVTDEAIDRVFAVMALWPQHVLQVLTKRSARMRAYMEGGRSRWKGPNAYPGARWPLPNVWLGVSAEDQTRADERVPDLLATPASVRFVSAEPLLGPIDMRRYLCGCRSCVPGGTGLGKAGFPSSIDWVIVGGESGRGARPMHPDWARSIRDQCAAAGVAFFFKQWGEWAPRDACPQAWDGKGPGLAFDMHHWPSAEGDGRNEVWRVGKKRAGRLLDGRTHDAMPEVRHG